MTLNPDDAAASLDEIASVERLTRQTVAYGRSSTFLILWGILLMLGYSFAFAFPEVARVGWLAIFAVGFGACAVLGSRRPTVGGRSRWDRPMLFGMLMLYGYGWVVQAIVPMTPRQQGAFWPSVFMLGFALAGLWLGRAFLFLAVAVTALAIAGYYWSGPWFGLWMAAVGGGGLLIGGLWLRRIGERG